MQAISPRPPGTTRVIFVRHGRSTYNDQQRFQGRSDRSVLTYRGWEAARQTGEALRALHFDAIYTSPLQRAKQTTQAIVEELYAPEKPSVEPIECPDLLEIDLPTWEGRTYTSVREELATDYQCWQSSPHAFSMTATNPAGLGALKDKVSFPVLDLYDRARAFWHSILSQHCDCTVLVIAHGGSIRAAIATAIGSPPQHYHRLQQSNCGISVVDFREASLTSPAILQAVNLTAHLGETLPKLKAGKEGLRIIMLPAQSNRLASLQQWSRLLSIDECWIDSSESASLSADKLAETTPISLRQDLSAWTSATRPHARSKTVKTVLAIAASSFLHQLLEAWMNVDSGVLSQYAIAPNTATVVHFPAPDRSSILQSLNFRSCLQRS